MFWEKNKNPSVKFFTLPLKIFVTHLFNQNFVFLAIEI
jgi:hypothetical protein